MKTHLPVNLLLISLICLGLIIPWRSANAALAPAQHVPAQPSSADSAEPIYTAALPVPCKAQVASTGQTYSVLQDAINAASEGDTVKVAGSCSDLRFDPSHNFLVVAYINKSLQLIGGYEPTFTASPDPHKYPTTIDAQRQGTGILTGGLVTISGFSIINGLYGGLITNGDATIKHNWILDNKISNNPEPEFSVRGSGIYVNGGNVLIEANYILHNKGGGGGGMRIMGDNVTIVNNIICENEAINGVSATGTAGGGIEFVFGEAMINHNTICNNQISGNMSLISAGIALHGYRATVQNNIVWGNGTGSSLQIFLGSYSNSSTVTYSDVQGGFSGEGNFDCEPQFRNPTGDDFHLLPGSCASDVGASLNVSQDIDGDLRPQANGYDVGADEVNSLSGTLFGQAAYNDHGVSGMLVHLYTEATPGVWFVTDTTRTDPLGQYSFSGLVDGDYRVGFSAPNGIFEPVFSGQQPTLSTAQTVSINQSYAIVNVTLHGSGAITGQVTLTGGGDPTPVVATLYEGTQTAIASISPNASGTYTFAGLLAGSDYHIYFVRPPTLNAPGVIPEYYDNAVTMAASQAITVTSGNVTSGINAQLDPVAQPIAIIVGNGTQYIDPLTGQVTLTVPAGNTSNTLISTSITCATDLTPPSDVTLWVGPNPYPMTETPPPGSGIYQVNLPANAIVTGQLVVHWRCGEEAFEKTIGRFFRYDPSGFIRDAHTGKPIANAIVTLYRVPNGLPDVTLPDKTVERRTCRTTQTRAGGPNGNWKAEPPAQSGIGVFVNPQILNDAGQSDIEPAINAQKTDANGHYGWDVVEGCWYVTVQARGYQTVYSPVVGVPPAVMDLDLDLPPTPFIFLPVISRSQ